MRVCKLFVFVSTVLFLCITIVTAQQAPNGTTLTMPEFPKMTGGMSMPSVSYPTMDGTFYRPSQSTSKTSQSKQTQQEPQKSTATITTPTLPSQSGLLTSPTLTATTTNTTSLESLLLQQQNPSITTAANATVSAQELSMLNSLGALGNVTRLLGSTTGQQPGQTDNGALLSTILTELQDIKKVQQQNLKSVKKATSTYGLRTPTGDPSILRFTINGRDVLSSCKTIYFSSMEQNGSFMVTGDRRYGFGSNSNTETFYLLFTTNSIEKDKIMYSVTPALSQGTEDTHSSLYKLSQAGILSAYKTGNLVTLHINNDGYKVDLLLDVGQK